MATVNDADLVFYPAFCFKASPTHFAWVKMSAADVNRLHQPQGFRGQNVYFYKNHPIRFVTVIGAILSIDEPAGAHRTILLLDDSSGATLEIVALHSPTTRTTTPAAPRTKEERVNTTEPSTKHVTATDRSALDISALEPGRVAKIKGTLSRYRDTMQLMLERFSIVRETNEEMQFLDERLHFLVEVLREPWVLSGEEIEGLRGEAEGEASRAGVERLKVRERVKRKAEKEEKDLRRIMRRYESDERRREREAVLCREEGAELMDDIRKRKGLG